MIRVSEKVTIGEVEKWKQGDIITISAGTGTGKSYFIKNNLYAIAKRDKTKILFLIHRVNTVNQFKMEIEKDKKQDVIEIMTYQSIETIVMHGGTFNFDDYKYIVCDEFHYFMSDASFNKYTDMSLNTILKQNNSIKIFMSATGGYMESYLKNYRLLDIKDYKLPINFNFIQNLIFFNKEESMEHFVKDAIRKNIKAIFFIDSAEKAYKLHKKYKEFTLFNCSKSNEKYYKYVDDEKIVRMLKNEKFDDLILITTTTMDSGVNILDDELNYIVCDVKDTNTLIQCIGRKRIQNKNDKINVYVKTITNKQLGGIETQLKRKIGMAEYLRKHTVEEFIKKYPRQNDYYGIVYDETIEGESDRVTKKVNDLMYFRYLSNITEVQTMIELGDFGYCKSLAYKLGFYDPNKGYEYVLLDEEYKKENLQQYLEGIVGEKLYKEQQNELIEKIDLRVDGKRLKSYRKLNQGLEMINLPFIIIPKKSNSVRYWIVEKIEM
jgi:hypothetical protein